MAGARIGEARVRKEDLRLITGNGSYADDIPFADVAHAFFVRSPYAFARILEIDTRAARALPGVLAVLVGPDAAAAGLKSIPHTVGGAGADVPLNNTDGTSRRTTPHLPLPLDSVRFVGEIVAFIVADSLAIAKDAAELIDIRYEPLESITQTPMAVNHLQALWDEIADNVCIDAVVGDPDATAAAFQSARYRVRLNTWVQRVAGVHMEPRAAIATFDGSRYTLHASGGIGVVRLREELAGVLDVPPEQIRVIAPRDVGGNFGTRNAFHPDFALIAWASRLLGRPVKHVAERQEAFLSDYQGRDLYVEAELALDEDGTFLAVQASNLSNVGAHTASFTALNKGVQLMTSVYRVPAAHVRARAVVTNTPSTVPYRSAGRPEAMFVVERLIDLAACECGFDRIALRRRNLVRPAEMPFRNPFGVTYDSGTYEAVMDSALELGDWTGFPARKAESRKQGKLRGISVANYVETTSGMPRERAEILILPDGHVDLIIGTQPTGQGHETSFSQLVSEWLGVPFDSVRVKFGDTDIVKAGGGSHSGRSMRFASIVIREASNNIIDKGKEIAAALLEAAVTDIEFVGGVFRIAGTNRSVSLFEAAIAALSSASIPEVLRGPLDAVSDKVTTGLAFPFGSHVCEVEVDPETGVVALVHYAAVDDVGRAVNPLILHGQTHGGIAQGVGQALMEHYVFDPETGQPLAASLMDYALPRADHFPFFATRLSEVPATSHPLGFRPGGEGGTTPALGSIINAIVDALSELGVRHIEMPATPERVWRAIRNASNNSTE